MKKFKSIRRAIKRGHVIVTYDAGSKSIHLLRKVNRGNYIPHRQ